MGKEEKIDLQKANEILGKWADEKAHVRLDFKDSEHLFQRYYGRITRIPAHGQAEAFCFEGADGASPISWIGPNDFRELTVVEGDDGEAGVILRKRKYDPPGYALELAFFKANRPDTGGKKLILPENPTIQ